MASMEKSAAKRSRGSSRREVSAGGVVWRDGPGGDTQVVLVRPAGRDAWVLPKGHLEPGETVAEAALREAQEETGIKASIGQPLGEVSYVFTQRDRAGGKAATIFKRVHFFLMDHQGGSLNDHDDEIAEAQWVDIDEAIHRLTYDNERELMVRARTMLRA